MYRFLFLLLAFPAFLSAQKPDLLLITIDTIRADHLGAYGNLKVRTPNLDALAKESLFFENAIAPAPLTLPSHTSLMTGRYPVRHGIHDNADVVEAKEVTLAEILRDHGYHTYAFIGGFPLNHRFGLNQGFDVYNDIFPRQKNRSLDFRSERGANAVVDAVLQTPIKRPFFLWVHFYDPHTPYFNGGYSGEIQFVDREIGRLLQKFQQHNPVIAVAGDHGESLGEHREWTHRIFLYDSTMRVPFWISGPGFSKNKISAQVRLIDFLPTILNSLKIPPPKSLDGVVLPAEAGRPALLESRFPELELGWSRLNGIRIQEWKFIDAPKPELYNLKSDPDETENVYALHKEVVKQLAALIPPAARAPAETKQISPEMSEQLASLGYVGGSPSKASNIDPKDRIQVWNEIEKAVDLEEKRPEESITILENALKSDPDNPMILSFLAQKYAESNRLKDAKSILIKVLGRNPENSLALYRIASVCLRTGELQEAKKYAERLRTMEKANADALILLAQANLAMQKYAEAAENILAALEIDPMDHDLRNDLGSLYLQSDRIDQAQAQFGKVLKLQPENVQALNGVAMCAFAQGDLVKAEASLLKSNRLDPKDPQTKMNLALIYSQQNRKEDALRLYRDVMSSPETPPDWKQEAARRLQQMQ